MKIELPGNVEIVDFTTENREYFKTLNIEWLKKYFVVEPIDEKVLSEPEKYILEKGGAIIFAKINNEIVGTCALKWKEGHTYELTKMAVTEKVQGLQLGKKLGIRILEVAKELKAEKVFLESNRRLSTALSLYRKLGFVEAINPYNSDYVRSDIYMEI
jgi:N-acetylglutamate synthase-like GNAT family acetyltransferase